MLLPLLGCSSTGGHPERGEQSLSLSLLEIHTYPANVYVGLSGPYATEEHMVERAIISCARSILLEEALALDSTLVMQDGAAKAFAVKEMAYYDEEGLKGVIEDLTLLSVSFDSRAGAVVLARYSRKPETRRTYPAGPDFEGRPPWLTSYPSLDGYRFGVGSSKAYYFLNDSLEASDFAAAQNLLDLYTEHAYSVALDTTRDGSAKAMDRVLYQAQRGLLVGFAIVDRYYEPETDTYWSLASITE